MASADTLVMRRVAPSGSCSCLYIYIIYSHYIYIVIIYIYSHVGDAQRRPLRLLLVPARGRCDIIMYIVV